MPSTKPTIYVHSWVSPCNHHHWHAHIKMIYPDGEKVHRASPPISSLKEAETELKERMAMIAERLSETAGNDAEIIYLSGNPEAN